MIEVKFFFSKNHLFIYECKIYYSQSVLSKKSQQNTAKKTLAGQTIAPMPAIWSATFVFLSFWRSNRNKTAPLSMMLPLIPLWTLLFKLEGLTHHLRSATSDFSNDAHGIRRRKRFFNYSQVLCSEGQW